MTKTFIGVIAAIVVLFDIYLYVYKVDNTISEQFREWNDQWPFVAWIFIFISGLLAGHFFWPLESKRPGE